MMLRLFANVGIVALVFAVCWGPVILATVAWLGTYNTANLFL